MTPEWIPLLGFPIEWAAIGLFVAGAIYAERSGSTGLLVEGSIACAVLGLILGYEFSREYALAAAAAALGAISFALLAATLIRILRADPTVGGFTLSLIAASALGLMLRSGTFRLLTERPAPGLVSGTIAQGTAAEPVLASPWLWSAPVLLALSAWILWRTPFGLRFRAFGEQPGLAGSAGRSSAHRMIALLLGALWLVPGAALLVRAYPDAPPVGLGFLALACAIAGRWSLLPGLLLAAGPALLRAARPYGERLGGWSIALEMAPFLLAVLYLMILSRRALRLSTAGAARADPDTL